VVSSAYASYAMQRMDRLYTIMKGRDVPKWIGMPEHYGFVDHRDLPAQYLIVQKINSGITIQDLLDYPDQPDDSPRKQLILKTLGPLDESKIDHINNDFKNMREIITAAVEHAGQSPKDYIVDWHAANVLYEKQPYPIAGRRYKLWLIDQ